MTEGLKKCPICGKELTVYSPEDWKPTFCDPDSAGEPYRATCDCGFEFSNGYCDYEDFVKAVNTRAKDCESQECEPPFGGKVDCEFYKKGLCNAK